MSSTRDLIVHAKKRGGFFTTAEAVDIGMNKTTLARRVGDGVFVKIRRGLYTLPGSSTRPDVLVRAAGSQIGAILSHGSAAKAHHMGPVPEPPLPTVTVPHRGSYRFPGLIVHQSTDLMPGHFEMADGIRVTNPARTIIDLARETGRNRLEWIIDNALASGVVDLEDLVELFLALSRQGKKGTVKLAKILRARGGETVPASVLESKLFGLLTESGLPIPEREFKAPWLEPIDGRVDFAYLSAQIVLEADSRRWHGLFQAFDVDKRRDIGAQLAGWMVLRFSWTMIEDDPEFVIRSVRTALELRT